MHTKTVTLTTCQMNNTVLSFQINFYSKATYFCECVNKKEVNYGPQKLFFLKKCLMEAICFMFRITILFFLRFIYSLCI